MQGNISSLGTILGIWAHPDDEIFSMAGVMTAAVRSGQQVYCITATRGEAGVQDEERWPAAELANIRTHELDNAYKIMGVNNHVWLDYPDGGCSEVDENEAADRIASLIRQYQPDSIMTFGPEGMTGHPDHQTVSRWAELARGKASSRAKIYHAVQTPEQYQAMQEADRELDIFYNIDQPPIYERSDCDYFLEFDNELCEVKINALRAMPSQTETMLQKYADQLKPAFCIEAFRLADL